MITFRDIVTALRGFGIDCSRPVIAHTSLSAFGEVQGGSETLLGAMLYVFPTLVMPCFTFRTMVVPGIGPPDNGIEYSAGAEMNSLAEFFQPDMPPDKSLGVIPEVLRRHPSSSRSSHPILSFCGVDAEGILEAQSLDQPLRPAKRLLDMHGWVFLLGMDQKANTSIHYAEQLAGRRQFIRWALTPNGVVECPRFPGCPDGFNQLETRTENSARSVYLGAARIWAIPLVDLVAIVQTWIEENPLALLCQNPRCSRCLAVRRYVAFEQTGSGLHA